MLVQPLGFVVFCVAGFAEAARLPFDLPEAEQELVGGYHTEYSGIKLMMYLVAEFLHMVLAAVPDRDPVPRRMAFLGPDRLGRAMTWPMAAAADRGAAGQGDGRDPVLHARPLELAAVPLRPVDGPGLERDDALGIVNVVVVAVWMEYGGRLASGWAASAGAADGRRRLDAYWSVTWLVVTLVGADRQRQPPAARCAAPTEIGEGRYDCDETDDQEHPLGEEPRLGMSGKIYLPLFVEGLTTTLRHLFGRKNDGPVARSSGTRFPIR